MFRVSNFEVFPPKLKLTWSQTSIFQVSNFEFFPPKREVLSTKSVLSWFTFIAVYKYEKNLRKSLKCGEISKFDTWNIDFWGHVSLPLGGKTSKFDTWNILQNLNLRKVLRNSYCRAFSVLENLAWQFVVERNGLICDLQLPGLNQ